MGIFSLNIGLVFLWEVYIALGGGGGLSQSVVYCSCLGAQRERVRFHPAGPEEPCQIGFQEQPSPRFSAVFHFSDDNLPRGRSFLLPQPVATWC